MEANSTSKLFIEYLPVGALTANPRNARTHSNLQIKNITKSIKTVGFANPLLIDCHNVIVAGHGRWQAAKAVGMAQVPTIRLEGLTDDQLRAYVIADNRLAEQAGWDQEILAIELQHLLSLDGDFDISVTGFEIPEIDLILQSAAKPDPEDTFTVHETGQPITQVGDLWLLGKHRVLCGNALQVQALAELMGKRRATIVFTDPPYNVAIDGNVCGKGLIHHREFEMGAGEMSEAEFVAFLTTSLGLLAHYSTAGSVHYVCMDWRHMDELLAAGQRIYDSLLNLCVWAKDNGGMGSFYRSQHELIFVFRNGKSPHRNNVKLGQYGRNRTNVWQYPGVNTLSKQSEEGNLLALHPTVKPVALVADALLDCSARGDIVLDSFLGSGTTVIAAERVGRICCGVELDPGYVDTTIRRWQKYSGEHGIHAASGRSFDEVATERKGR